MSAPVEFLNIICRFFKARKEALDLAAVFSELRPGRNLYQKKFSNSDNKFETSSSIISNKIFRNSAISYLELV